MNFGIFLSLNTYLSSLKDVYHSKFERLKGSCFFIITTQNSIEKKPTTTQTLSAPCLSHLSNRKYCRGQFLMRHAKWDFGPIKLSSN